MTEAYYNDRILVKKRWYGNKYKDNIVKVKVLGETYIKGSVSHWYMYAIQLPSGRKEVVHGERLFTYGERLFT